MVVQTPGNNGHCSPLERNNMPLILKNIWTTAVSFSVSRKFFQVSHCLEILSIVFISEQYVGYFAVASDLSWFLFISWKLCAHNSELSFMLTSTLSTNVLLTITASPNSLIMQSWWEQRFALNMRFKIKYEIYNIFFLVPQISHSRTN